MSKILQATCINNIVTCEGVIIDGCTVLSEGMASSSGVLIIDDDKKYYVAKISPDLKTSLGHLINILTQITGCFAALDALPTISGTCAAFTAQITAIQLQLTTLKELLK